MLSGGTYVVGSQKLEATHHLTVTIHYINTVTIQLHCYSFCNTLLSVPPNLVQLFWQKSNADMIEMIIGGH